MSEMVIKDRDEQARLWPYHKIADLENERKLIYLGCPYSHPNPHVKTQRFEAVTKVGIFLVVGNFGKSTTKSI
jgi:hypothetical protein